MHVPLERLNNTTDVQVSGDGLDSVASPHIEDAVESYLSPAYSAPLLKIWMPEYVVHLASLDDAIDQSLELGNTDFAILSGRWQMVNTEQIK